MNRIISGMLLTVASSGIVFAGAIDIDSTSFTKVITFDSLGTGNVAWDDGNTIEGVYLDSESAGIPTTVNKSIGDNSSALAYNMGLSGDSDRALGWLTGSATGRAWTGAQFRNKTGQDSLKLSYAFVMEQWGKRNTSEQEFTLQYKVSSTGGNILNSSSWTTLGTATTPVVDGSSPYELNGNTNQFSISGTDLSLAINDGQYLTFRLVDLNHSGSDAMVGVDSISVEVIPESATISLMGMAVVGALFVRRLRI